MSDILITGDGQFPMDVQVPIVSAQTMTGARTVIVAQGDYRGCSVGVELSVRGEMKPGIVGSDIDRTAFYRSGELVRSMGELTKHLADVFSEVLSFRSVSQNRFSSLISQALLDGDPMLIETEHLNFKVFHDDEDKLGLYFEMFLHIDIPGGYVRLGKQLVGALVNLAAGAEHNATAEGAIKTAETLLEANKLNLLTSSVHPSTTLGQALLVPAGILDGYNSANFHTCSESSGLTLGD